jgi:hypothetical protein
MPIRPDTLDEVLATSSLSAEEQAAVQEHADRLLEAASTPEPRNLGGRPVEIPNAVARTFRVNLSEWDAGKDRARGEGRDLSDVMRELLSAYVQGRVRIVKGGRK